MTLLLAFWLLGAEPHPENCAVIHTPDNPHVEPPLQTRTVGPILTSEKCNVVTVIMDCDPFTLPRCHESLAYDDDGRKVCIEEWQDPDWSIKPGVGKGGTLLSRWCWCAEQEEVLP